MIARVWFAKEGAGRGLPWYVQMGSNAPELCDNFELVGYARPVFRDEGHAHLPEAPRALIEVEVPPAPSGLFARLTAWLARRAGWRLYAAP